MCVCACMHACVHVCCVHVHAHVWVSMCAHVQVHMHIHECCVSVCVRRREREGGEGGREKETDRQTDREIERERERGTSTLIQKQIVQNLQCLYLPSSLSTLHLNIHHPTFIPLPARIKPQGISANRPVQRVLSHLFTQTIHKPRPDQQWSWWSVTLLYIDMWQQRKTYKLCSLHAPAHIIMKILSYHCLFANFPYAENNVVESSSTVVSSG